MRYSGGDPGSRHKRLMDLVVSIFADPFLQPAQPMLFSYAQSTVLAENRYIPGGYIMKQFLALVAALLFACSLVSAAFAADTPTETRAPAAPAKAEKKAAKEKIHTFEKGEVKAVDAAARTLTARNRKQEKTFVADAAMLAGIKVGDTVSVKFIEKDGKTIARSVKKIEKKADRKAEPKKEEKKADSPVKK
jgi:Cu/Ag efflux protein CusF